jgi:predicted phosphodiesterase
MRTALVSDIHGNAVALEALIADLERNPVDQVVCLGDVAQGGAQPAEVIDLLRDLRWPVVIGNADDFLLGADIGAEPVTPRLLEVRAWSVGQLGPERLDYIRSFSPTIEAGLGDGRTLLAFHGSPGSYNDVILPPLEEEQFRSFLGGHEASVLAGGHVHLQWVRRLGNSVFVNPGSVGLSYDHEQPEEDFHFDPWAAYSLVTTGGGELELAFRRVPFDWERVVRVLTESGIPHSADSIERWTPAQSR